MYAIVQYYSVKKIARNVYQFPIQQFFGEPVRAYALEEPDFIYCFDIPQDTEHNTRFLKKLGKPIRIIMSHGSTSNGFESTRGSLRRDGLDVQVWLHERDQLNSWLTIEPDELLTGENRQLSENLTLVVTPGHTKGGVCLFAGVERGFMFTGDTLGGTANGDIRPFFLKTNDLDPKIFFVSLRKLLDYQFEYMYPFHYYPIEDARNKLEQFIDEEGR